MNNNYCIIMAGGVGSRLWPLSTSKKPKQFHDLLGVGKTILQLTFERVALIIPKENIYIVINKEFEEITKAQLIGVNEKQIIIEPHTKNTAICNLYAALKIYKKNKNAKILVTPSDQIIVNESLFIENLKFALEKASANNLITFGIKPTSPNTGFGYIQFETEKNSEGLNKVKLFTEKPNLEIATSFIESGDFMWNAGIFIWAAESILNAFKLFLPEMYTSFMEIEDSINTINEEKAIQRIYSYAQNISIDYAILEKSTEVYMVVADFGWSDLGTWQSLYEQSTKDIDENVKINSVTYTENSKRNIIKSTKNKIVVLQDVSDYIIIDTKDVLMILPKKSDQDVKKIVTMLKLNKKSENFI